MKTELKQLKEMQGYLSNSSKEIDEINKERKEARIKMTEIENKLVGFIQEKKQIA